MKTERESNMQKTWVKKGQGFLFMSGFPQAELPFLEGVQIRKSCDACKRALAGYRKKKLLIDAILCPPISNL